MTFAFRLFSIAILAGTLSGCLPTVGSAQTGMDTELWKTSVKGQHHDAVVQVDSSGGIGTGVIIAIDKDKPAGGGFKGYCLTAWHVVQDDKDQGEICVLYRNGRKAKNCRVVEHDESADVALLYVWIPDGVEPVRVSQRPVQKGDELEFAGLGGGSQLSCCLRHFVATASMPSSEQKIFSDVPLLPGDSGGPVFNKNNEVVGIISGGWFWWDGGVKTENGNALNATWPARAANVGPIQRLLSNVENSETVFR
jgi:S1-C subfamily serine protease